MKSKQINEDNLNLSEFPSKHWEKFFNKFEEIQTLPISEWTIPHLIGYFCQKYQNYYGVKFSFKFNSLSPSKSYEVVQLRKLGQMLSSDSKILKEYIDWFFEKQIFQRKKRITSLAYFCDANIVNQFKFKYLALDSSKTIERSSKLPENYQLIVNQCGYDYTNYGQLSFHKKVVDNGTGSSKDQELLDKLIEAKLDLATLDKVK